MSPGPTFDRVYLGLKEQLASARFGPGDHLDPSLLGNELSASITPVRDALHRLVGERLVDAPRNEGFRVPAPTEAQLRNLYGWNRELLELALRRGASVRRVTDPTDFDADASQPRARLEPGDLFRIIAAASANPELEAAVISINGRLAPVREAEQRLFLDWESELEALRSAVARQDVSEIRRVIANYHRRRQRSVPDLLVGWRRFAAPA
jgi:DNA-binding GntR family transcriptional regulator